MNQGSILFRIQTINIIHLRALLSYSAFEPTRSRKSDIFVLVVCPHANGRQVVQPQKSGLD